MRLQRRFLSDADGFTLVEVIVTIVIGAVASVLLIQFMGGNMERSLAPLVRIDQSYRLTTVMENITAHYKNLLLTDADPLGTFEDDIRNGNVVSNTPYFGDYSPTLQYVDLSSSSESPCVAAICKVLRVDLQRDQHRLTALFAN